MRRTILFVFTWFTFSVPAAFAQQAINSCGDIATSNAVLTADLDCTGLPVGVTVTKGKKLELAGFTISGADSYGIECEAGCKVLGPGTVDSNEVGIVANGKTRLSDVIVSNSGATGVQIGVGPLPVPAGVIERTTIDGGAGDGLVVRGKVKMTDSTVTMNAGMGVRITEDRRNATIRGSLIADNGSHGLWLFRFGKVSVKDSTIVRNGGSGVRASNIESLGRMIRSTISENAVSGFLGVQRIKDSDLSLNGVVGGPGRVHSVVNSTVLQNGVAGIFVSSSKKTKISGSQLTGNGFNCTCTTTTKCADIIGDRSESVVNFVNSSCDTSADSSVMCPPLTLRVCSMD